MITNDYQGKKSGHASTSRHHTMLGAKSYHCRVSNVILRMVTLNFLKLNLNDLAEIKRIK